MEGHPHALASGIGARIAGALGHYQADESANGCQRENQRRIEIVVYERCNTRAHQRASAGTK
jgi:hypothetical protein